MLTVAKDEYNLLTDLVPLTLSRPTHLASLRKSAILSLTIREIPSQGAVGSDGLVGSGDYPSLGPFRLVLKPMDFFRRFIASISVRPKVSFLVRPYDVLHTVPLLIMVKGRRIG